MASLMCVIYALDIRYTRELVDNVDILVNLLIPENFARAIDNLIEDKILINTLSKRGRKKAKIMTGRKL